MASAKTVPLTCHGHSRPVTHLSFSPLISTDHYYLISGCKDNHPMIRDGITGDWIGTFIGHKGAVWQSRLSEDASLAVTASADYTAKIWDPSTGECRETLQHDRVVRAVAFAPGPTPQLIATGGFEKKLRIFDLGSAGSQSTEASAGGSAIPSYEVGAGAHGDTIKSLVWGQDHNLLVSAAEDKVIRWWDLRSSAPAASYTVDGPLGSCELSLPSSGAAADSILAVAGGKNAYFFSGQNPGQLIKSYKMKQEVASVAVSPDANRFVIGCNPDTWVRVHDFEEGKELEVYKGHHGPVWSISFSPDGKLCATGSEDGTIKLWKFATHAYGLWR